MRCTRANLSYGIWNKTSFLRTVARILISLVAFGIFNLPMVLIKKEMADSYVFVIMVAKIFAPCFFSSFFFFGLSTSLFMKIGLINERSIGGMFESLSEDQTEGDLETRGAAHVKNGSLEFVEIEMASR